MEKPVRDARRGGPVLCQKNNGVQEYLTFPALEAIPGVRHFFSTRLGGVSKGDFSTWSFSYSRGDDPEAVRENFRRAAGILGVSAERIVSSQQTHTTNIRRVTAQDAGKGVTAPCDYTDVDGMITDERGLVLACFYADCVPLYLVDPVRNVIGLAHSGWRGTVGKIGKHMVEAMAEAFGSRPRDLVTAIGPSICQSCYEVSEDVAEAFREAFRGMEELEERCAGELYGAADRRILIPGREHGKYQLDLWLANRVIFCEAGVSPDRISVTDLCTCHNPKYLFSHRASFGKRGNLGAFLMLEKSV